MLNLLGLGLAFVLGVSAVILIANTIRMAIYARRDEVAIMKLVGASNWFVRMPFILEGMIEGLIGAGLAVTTVWVASRNLRTLGETDRNHLVFGPRPVLPHMGDLCSSVRCSGRCAGKRAGAQPIPARTTRGGAR